MFQDTLPPSAVLRAAACLPLRYFANSSSADVVACSALPFKSVAVESSVLRVIVRRIVKKKEPALYVRLSIFNHKMKSK